MGVLKHVLLVCVLKHVLKHDNLAENIGRVKVGRQFVPSDNSSQATIRPKRQFVTNSKKRQFVPSVNSSHFEKATIRPICKKRQFVPNCLVDQLITNLLKVETKEIIKPTTNEFIQPRDNN